MQERNQMEKDNLKKKNRAMSARVTDRNKVGEENELNLSRESVLRFGRDEV